MSSADEELGPHPTTQAALRLLPKIGPLAASWRQEMFDRDQRRLERLGAAAAEDLGTEKLFEQIAASERLSDMFRAAVEAAVTTSSDAKIRLLGRALASGATAQDAARVDEAEQLLRVAIELDPVDLRALTALRASNVSDPRCRVTQKLGVSTATAGPVVARLERLSLIEVERLLSIGDTKDLDDDSIDTVEEWRLTETARAVLNLLANEPKRPSPGV